MRGKTVEERLLSRTVKNAETQCWECNYSIRGHGYPAMDINQKNMRCSRIAYTLWRGPLPENLCVLHSCDNRKCINPDHLFLGTHADNIADRDKKGRQAKGNRNGSRLHPELLVRGESHPNSKLAELDIQTIRVWSGKGFSNVDIAKMFGVHQSTIQRIIQKQTWKHI